MIVKRLFQVIRVPRALAHSQGGGSPTPGGKTSPSAPVLTEHGLKTSQSPSKPDPPRYEPAASATPVRDKLDQIKDATKETMASVSEKSKETFEHAQSMMHGALHNASDAAKNVGHAAAEKVRSF
jgi:hypothetical protein